MKYFSKRGILLASCVWSLASWADKVASLPGGLVFPAFSSSALVDAAALALDWRGEGKVLYSPPAQQDPAHAYLSSFAFSNGFAGFNVGYQGSYQEGSAFSGAFAGLGLRLGKLALGCSARNVDLKSSEKWKRDFSAIYRFNSQLRLGASLFDAGENPQWGLGIGLGRPQKRTLALDVLIPSGVQPNSFGNQYSASITATTFFEKVGLAAGIRYDRFEDGFLTPEKMSAFAATSVVIKQSLNLTAQYESNPSSVTVGLVWVWSPPAKNLIDYFKVENKKTIWDRQRR